MRALRSIAGVVSLGVLVGTTVWGGASEARAQDQQRARQLYAEAQALFESGQYAAAESSFRAAYEAVPNAVVLKAIAAAQERQGNIPGALETLRRYLREAPPSAADRVEVEQRIQELSARPATIIVTSTPEGAAIHVDGADTGWVTPAEVEVSAGEHTVELRLTGYQVTTQTFEAAASTRVRVEMTLEPSSADEAPEADAFGTEGGDGGALDSNAATGEGGGSDDPSAGVWVTAGLGAAGLISGTVFGFLALSEQSNFDAEPNHETADRGEAFALVADISFGVAAAMAITSIVLYIVERSSGGSSEASSAGSLGGEQLRVNVGAFADPQGGGVAARLRF